MSMTRAVLTSIQAVSPPLIGAAVSAKRGKLFSFQAKEAVPSSRATTTDSSRPGRASAGTRWDAWEREAEKAFPSLVQNPQSPVHCVRAGGGDTRGTNHKSGGRAVVWACVE